MAKPKHIKPAPPVATYPDLQELELSKRREIARLKEADMDEGRRQSLSTSVIVSDLNAKVLRGDKMVLGGRKGHEITHGTLAAKEQRWAYIARNYAALKREHPDWREKQLEAETATRCGVSTRTVQKYKHYEPGR